MLDLATFNDSDDDNFAIIETNHGEELKTSGWPTDGDFEIVAYRASKKTCEVVSAEDLADDIAMAVQAMRANGMFKEGKPDWCKRLELYADGSTFLRR
jgi:hypothetical protein